MTVGVASCILVDVKSVCDGVVALPFTLWCMHRNFDQHSRPSFAGILAALSVQ